MFVVDSIFVFEGTLPVLFFCIGAEVLRDQGVEPDEVWFNPAWS